MRKVSEREKARMSEVKESVNKIKKSLDACKSYDNESEEFYRCLYYRLKENWVDPIKIQHTGRIMDDKISKMMSQDPKNNDLVWLSGRASEIRYLAGDSGV